MNTNVGKNEEKMDNFENYPRENAIMESPISEFAIKMALGFISRPFKLFISALWGR